VQDGRNPALAGADYNQRHRIEPPGNVHARRDADRNDSIVGQQCEQRMPIVRPGESLDLALNLAMKSMMLVSGFA
jgi:hypothetical protein